MRSEFGLQTRDDFIRKHVNADVLVMDTETDLPVKAEYTGPVCGRLRETPAVFWYPEY